jgi:hypothetical protein
MPVDDLSRDGQAKNIARLHRALDAFIAIDPANLSAGERDDREMLIKQHEREASGIETVRYWQKDPDVYVSSATSAVFNLVHRDFAPLADRLRSVIARERQIPILLATGKANIEHPPLAFVEIAIRGRRDIGQIDRPGRRSRHHRGHPAPECSNIAERSFRDLSPLRRSRLHTVCLVFERQTQCVSLNAL